jgi:LacI family transcriptional regulator
MGHSRQMHLLIDYRYHGGYCGMQVLMSRPTIYDVAALASVGVKTVSRYLNGVAVRPATAKAIRKAVEQLGYRRNDSAAQLRLGTTASIGLVVDDVSEPFQSVLARAVEEVTAHEGSVLMTASSEKDPDRERLVIETFLSRRVDGLIDRKSVV